MTARGLLLAVVVFFVIGGAIFVWREVRPRDAVAELHATCQKLGLEIRTVEVEPGSLRDQRLKAMVPSSQRVETSPGSWLLCRANLIIR